ncbi:hypothetical protein ES708_26612 [subsurface metagenome]
MNNLADQLRKTTAVLGERATRTVMEAVGKTALTIAEEVRIFKDLWMWRRVLLGECGTMPGMYLQKKMNRI